MSETENPVTTDETAEEGGASKKSFKKIIILAVILIVLGGGGFYYWQSKSAAAADDEDAEAVEKDEKPSSEKKSKRKKPVDDSEEETEEAEKPAKKSSSLKAALPNDEDVKKIIELPPFIVNLADSENARYLRMSVSLGVGGEEGGSEKPDQLFMTRVRNAMLAVLSEKKSDEILTVEGKGKLRRELLKAAQAASEEPHVEAIYITDFIVQL